jgi:plastocyanin
MRTLVCLLVVSAASIAFREAPPADARAAGAAAQARGTGALRGRVSIERPAEAPGRRPAVADLAGATTNAAIESRPVIVFLDAPDVPESSVLRAGHPAPPPVHARMDQRDEAFSPHVLTVNTGSVVDFPNNDRTFHNVFSLSKTKKFDLGRYGRGKSKTERFDRAGIVRVFCDIHSHMSAFVLVFNHPYYTTAAEDGQFEIDNIPAGTYTVIAWHEGEARDTRAVSIPAGGGYTELDLAVR